MNTTTMDTSTTKTDRKTQLRIIIVVLLSIALAFLIFLPGWGEIGPAPGLTGKIISVVPASSQDKLKDKTVLGTMLIQRNDGYQLLLIVHHATGDGCLGQSTLHLSDIKVGEITTVRYWLDKPETGSNPHNGHAVYVGDRC